MKEVGRGNGLGVTSEIQVALYLGAQHAFRQQKYQIANESPGRSISSVTTNGLNGS